MCIFYIDTLDIDMTLYQQVHIRRTEACDLTFGLPGFSSSLTILRSTFLKVVSVPQRLVKGPCALEFLQGHGKTSDSQALKPESDKSNTGESVF